MESVETTSINVDWSCRAIGNATGSDDTDSDPLKEPRSLIKGEELHKVKRLSLYESYELQIHDRFYLKYSKCDLLVKYADWENEQGRMLTGNRFRGNNKLYIYILYITYYSGEVHHHFSRPEKNAAQGQQIERICFH